MTVGDIKTVGRGSKNGEEKRVLSDNDLEEGVRHWRPSRDALLDYEIGLSVVKFS